MHAVNRLNLYQVMKTFQLPLKQCALNVCYDLAVLIVSGDVSAWKIADRVERRWRIQGCTLAHVDRMKREQAEHRKALSRYHDSIFPDRLTYLHR